jgi:hypothetical protein
MTEKLLNQIRLLLVAISAMLAAITLCIVFSFGMSLYWNWRATKTMERITWPVTRTTPPFAPVR